MPGLGLASQCGDVPNPSLSKALATEDANLNLSLVEPTSMLRRVVNGKAIPQPSSRHFAEAIHQRLAGVGAQIIHVQMDGVGGGIVRGDLQDEAGKLGGCARRRYFGEMNASRICLAGSLSLLKAHIHHSRPPTFQPVSSGVTPGEPRICSTSFSYVGCDFRATRWNACASPPRLTRNPKAVSNTAAVLPCDRP